MIFRQTAAYFILACTLGCLHMASASAHFLWLDSEPVGETRTGLLFFGEGPQDRNYHLPEPIAAAEVFARTDNGKRDKLSTEPRETDDYVGLEMPLPTAKTASLETVCEYGIYGGAMLCYYSQHLLPTPDGKLSDIAPSAELKLNIVPKRKPGGVAATVLWKGKPLSDAEVTMIDPDGESSDQTTDGKGQVFFLLAKKGTVGLMTNHSEKEKSGEFNGQKFKGQANYATLTFDFTPSGKAAEPAKKVSTTKQSQSTEHSFGPPLPEAISSFGAAVNDGWLYVYGGHTGKAHQHSRENLSHTFARLKLGQPTEWEPLEMGTPLQGTAMVSCGESLFRVGGLDARNSRKEADDLHSVAEFARFDPATGKWTALPPLPAPRSSLDAAALDGKIYVVGGWALSEDRAGDWQTAALAYDTTAGEKGHWQELSPPPFQRRALALATWQNRIWVLGGMDEFGDIQRTVYSFDPSTNIWEEGTAMPGDDMQGFGISAWGMDSGLYVSGTDGKLYRLAEPNGKWEAVAELETPRFFHRLMPDGQGGVLAVAGASLMDGHLKEIERLQVD